MTRDRIDGVHIAVGQGDEADTAELRHVKPCARCPIPNIDPATAQSSPCRERYAEHLPQRQAPGRGHYLRHECRGGPWAGQMLRVGQRFGAHYCFD